MKQQNLQNKFIPGEDGHFRDDQCGSSCGYGFVKQPDRTYAYRGATHHDLALMRKHAAPDVQVKAAGGVRTLEDTFKVREMVDPLAGHHICHDTGVYRQYIPYQKQNP